MTFSADTADVLVVHGPNLNQLGTREPDIYGSTTLEEIDRSLKKRGDRLGLRVVSFQSNHEGAIVDRLQAACAGRCRGLIINPAAYTHTSVAIRDALLLLDVPAIEVHLSNINRRESFRRRSLVADVVTGRIAGLGAHGYLLALDALAAILSGEVPGGPEA